MAAKRTGPLSSSNNAVSAPGTALSHVRESWSTIVVRISRHSQRVWASGRFSASMTAAPNGIIKSG